MAYGGLYVLQPPYLLFYPDKDGDDRPDGDPQVLLKGFGMEDAHSVANSLTWGPDGWLYGCQGSTVTANIRLIEFQQGVWRYHPISHRFELFCEGGGNSWGLDFDEDGNPDVAYPNTGIETGSHSTSIFIYFGDGTGKLVAGPTITVGQEPHSVVAADFNKDGHLDLVDTDRTGLNGVANVVHVVRVDCSNDTIGIDSRTRRHADACTAHQCQRDDGARYTSVSRLSARVGAR